MKINLFPKISVITPSFNSDKYIEEAIKSVLCQNYRNFEHIIVDGGSRDGTKEILKKYSHLKWVSEPDRGQSHAMNKGFRMSTGEIIVYLNADDFFEPEAFQRAVQYLDKEKNILFMVGELYYVDINGNKEPSNDTKVELFEMLQWWKSHSFPHNPVSYFYFREVQETVGGFNEENHLSMDYEFLLKVASKYKIKKINDYLGNYRFIEGTKSFDSTEEDNIIKYKSCGDFYKYLSFKDRLIIKISYYRTINPLFRFIFVLIYKKLFKGVTAYING